ncbi:ABC transporter permease [Thermosulfurimonas dismutans]|uniref:Capsular polysaccharide ABC transporter, permease protein KpsM n=1 Tax=Thermosulfurimonas dismutans TaxID=999894 RepID=A0A179D1C2_9BACT|nr:ABC transporter permease [Thermosulfurimonas dismutans]OAQ19856.1 Capsular polysaccharide ABC transporter, permease protein KpsM [Thermosulfurimonas dismutans]
MNSLTEFIEAFRIQKRIIHALMMREIITRYGRKNIGFLWLFVEPALITLIFTLVHGLFRGRSHSDFPAVIFMLSGYSASSLWRNVATHCLAAIKANIALLYHRYVKILDLLLSRFVLEIGAVTGAFLFLFMVFHALKMASLPVNYFHVVQGWFLMCWLGMALGFITGSLATISEVFSRIWPPLNLIFFITGGTFFLIEWVPEHFRKLILLLPMAHNIEMVRYGFLGGKMHPYYSVEYSVMANLFLTLIGLLLVKYVSQKEELIT